MREKQKIDLVEEVCDEHAEVSTVRIQYEIVVDSGLSIEKENKNIIDDISKKIPEEVVGEYGESVGARVEVPEVPG